MNLRNELKCHVMWCADVLFLDKNNQTQICKWSNDNKSTDYVGQSTLTFGKFDPFYRYANDLNSILNQNFWRKDDIPSR